MLKLTAETFIDLREEEEEFMKQLEAIHNSYVEVGILADAGQAENSDGSESGISLAELASVHEYGSTDGKIPQRSFIGSTMDEQYTKFNDTTNKLLAKITNREMKSKLALSIIGAEIKSEIQKKIRSNIAPGLKQSTIERKNKNKIEEAKVRVASMPSKAERQGYRNGQRRALGGRRQGPIQQGAYKPELTDSQKTKNNSDALLIMTGGKSTALIDTGQLVNSIAYRVDMENKDGNGQSRVDLEDENHD